MYRSHVLVCGGTGCTSSGSQKIIEKLEAEIKKMGLRMKSTSSGPAASACAPRPDYDRLPGRRFYSMVKEEDIPEIVEEHLLKGPYRHAPPV